MAQETAQKPGLTTCPACNKEVSKKAPACPGCGEPLKKMAELPAAAAGSINPSDPVHFVGIIICIFMALGVVALLIQLVK